MLRRILKIHKRSIYGRGTRHRKWCHEPELSCQRRRPNIIGHFPSSKFPYTNQSEISKKEKKPAYKPLLRSASSDPVSTPLTSSTAPAPSSRSGRTPAVPPSRTTNRPAPGRDRNVLRGFCPRQPSYQAIPQSKTLGTR